jgi:hypothetical protein
MIVPAGSPERNSVPSYTDWVSPSSRITTSTNIRRFAGESYLARFDACDLGVSPLTRCDLRAPR